MNSKRFTQFRIAILALCMTGSTLFAQLGGNYTIDPTKSASSTNYLTWESAVNDLLNGSRTDGGTAQGPGISTDVNFTAYDTTYTSVAIELTAIPGANPTRRVTFQSASGDRNKCLLTNASSTSATNDFVLMVNGADYVSFKNIGFYRTGTNTYSTVVQILNDANGLVFDNCLIRGRKVPSSSSLGFNYIYGAGMYFGGNADSTTVKNCRFLYGYNGIYCATTCSDNVFSNNVIDTAGSSGMYITLQTRLQVVGNTFNMGDFGPNQGHYTSYAMRIESSPSMVVANNKAFMLAVNAQVVRALIIASTTSTAAAPTMVYNNWIVNSGGSGDCTGFALYSCNYINFIYNNVLITSSLTTSAAYYLYPQYSNTYIRLLNNNFVNKGAGYAYNVPGTNTGNHDTADYNNIYSSGNYLANWGGTNYSSLSSLKSASSKDNSSISVDPGYVSNNNLHVSNISLNKKALRYDWVKYDIDMELRDTTGPDIGADEFFPIANDAGITLVDSPSTFCAGTHNVRVKFQNYGIDTLKSVSINWSVNSTSQTSYTWTGLLAPGGSSASVSLGSYSFSANTPYKIVAWTSKPNNSSDGKNINDTLSVVKIAGMTGNYTIGSSGDFKSFNSAIGAYTARGICGPITFTVSPGTYNEQLTLVQLPGMNSNNPIKFVSSSNDSTQVVITLPSTIATGNNNAAVQLRGADYITFEGITMERTGNNIYAQVIHILNGSNHNTFKRCRMLGLKLTAQNTSAVNIWSDQGKDEYNSFINNTIKYGHSCVDYTGADTAREKGTVFSGNWIDSSYTSLVKLSYNNDVVFEKNTLGRQSSALSGNFSLMLNDCDGTLGVNANKFIDGATETSLSLLNCLASSNSKSLISNNFIPKTNGKGINIEASEYIDIAHNTLYLSGNSANNIGINLVSSASSNISLLNNIVMTENGLTVSVPSSGLIASSNYNNFYTKGTTGLGYWSGNTYYNINDLAASSSKDANSKSVNPLFKSSLDLHCVNPRLKKAGTPLSNVTTDIDGELRNTSTPDIGADEFLLSANDAGVVEMIDPVTGTCAGVYNLTVAITNFGSDTLRSVDVKWIAQTTQQATYQWTGSLASNETDTFVIGSFNFTNTLNPKFTFWTVSPNGKQDAISFNDSLVLNRSMRSLPVANAGADADVCKGESIQIGPTALSGFSYSWTDLSNNLISTNSKIIVSPLVNTSYVLEVTNTTYGCKKKDTIAIGVKNNPTVNAGTDASVCLGNVAQIGENKQNGFNYQWSSIPSGFSSTLSKLSVNPTVTTRYILRKADSLSNCLNRDTVDVTVIQPPVTTMGGLLTACEGNSMTYTATPTNGHTYQWKTTGGTLLSGQNTNSIVMKWGSRGSYDVTVVESNSSGCKDTASVTVNVNLRPKAVFNVVNVCQGSNSDFVNTSMDANSYFWYFGDNGTSSLQSPSHKYDTAGSYDVMLIAMTPDCYDTAKKSAVVYELPVAKFTSTKQGGKKYGFTDQSTSVDGTISEWEWSFGEGGSDNTQNPVYSYALVGNYQVELCVKTSNGCSKCIKQFITVTSIDDIARMYNLKVMPNPGTGVYQISASQDVVALEVFNSTGQRVEVAEALNENGQLDLTSLSDGVYTLRVKIGQDWAIVKVVKQN